MYSIDYHYLPLKFLCVKENVLYVDNYRPYQELLHSVVVGLGSLGATIFATKILHVRLFLTKGHVPHNTKGDTRVVGWNKVFPKHPIFASHFERKPVRQ